MTVEFVAVRETPAPPEAVFDLALDVEAHALSMARSGERVVGGITRGRLGLDDDVTWRGRHFGIRWTMTSRITEWDRPHRFVDEQVRGPFVMFRHEHVFEPTAEGGTRMVDRVAFRAPAGVLGRIAERVVLARHLRHLIEVRQEYLHQELTG